MGWYSQNVSENIMYNLCKINDCRVNDGTVNESRCTIGATIYGMILS